MTISKTESFFSGTFFLTSFLVCAAAVGNALGAYVVFEYFTYRYVNVWSSALSFAIGALVAQPCLLAVWLSLSNQKLVVRSSIAIGLIVMLTLGYLAALVGFQRRGMPGQIPLIIGGLSLTIFVLVSIPLIVFRVKTERSISKGNKDDVDLNSMQFGIRHILIATTVFAVAIPLAQPVFSTLSFDRDTPWFEILTFVGLFALLVWNICLLSVAVVFSNQRVRYLVVLVLTTLIAPIFVSIMLSLIFDSFRPFELTSCINSVLFAVSFSGSMIMVLWSYRAIGFQLSQA